MLVIRRRCWGGVLIEILVKYWLELEVVLEMRGDLRWWWREEMWWRLRRRELEGDLECLMWSNGSLRYFFVVVWVVGRVGRGERRMKRREKMMGGGIVDEEREMEYRDYGDGGGDGDGDGDL